MNIFKAVANIEASDCYVYILQGDKKNIQITLDSQGKLYALDSLNKEEKSETPSLSYISTDRQFTLLPNLSIEQLPLKEIASFLKWNDKPDFNIIKNKLMFDNISILFQIQQKEITKLFPTARIHHGIEILANHCMKQQERDAITTLILENKLILCVVKNGHLQLSNIFQVENNEEVIYYIMLMVQELDLNAETLNLHLFGECEEKAFLKENLSHFVRNITSHVHPSIADMKYSGIAKFIELIQ